MFYNYFLAFLLFRSTVRFARSTVEDIPIPNEEIYDPEVKTLPIMSKVMMTLGSLSVMKTVIIENYVI